MSNTAETIHLVRALVKISSALTDMDKVIYGDDLKFNLKKDLPKFQSKLEILIDEPSKILLKSDSTVLTHLINVFDDFSELVYVKNDYITNVNLFLAKITSAYNDLEKLQTSDTHYIKALRSLISGFLDKKYLNQFTTWEDPEGNTFYSLIKKLEDITNEYVITK